MRVKMRGLTTGIGSLPHKDVEAALDLVFAYTPNMPFWPQLPRRDKREGMIAQFSENLPFLTVNQTGVSFLGVDAQDRELEIFYERIIANDIDYFKISEDLASGLYGFYRRLQNSDLRDIDFIKCQVTGPFTFAASIKDDKGAYLLHDAVFLQAVLKGLTMKALWQIKLFKKFAKKIILFLDEPYLSSFGSAYTPINREDVIRLLSELTGSIKQYGDIMLGVHCCGNTDWSIFTDPAHIDIISFDAYGFQDRFVLYADNLKGFLKRGGIICWGLVPTQEFSREEETAGALLKKLNTGIDVLAKKGLDKEMLLSGLLLSPSCGLGSLDTEKAEKIFKLLSEISFLIRKSLKNKI